MMMMAVYGVVVIVLYCDVLNDSQFICIVKKENMVHYSVFFPHTQRVPSVNYHCHRNFTFTMHCNLKNCDELRVQYNTNILRNFFVIHNPMVLVTVICKIVEY